MAQVAFGLQVTNVEMEVAKKITAEHIAAELKNKHEREMRRLELEAKEADSLESEREREHERDGRRIAEIKESDARSERIS